jgi:dihydroorotate dehydrogenase
MHVPIPDSRLPIPLPTISDFRFPISESRIIGAVGLYKDLLRPALFRLDPETAHGLAMRALRVPGAARLLGGRFDAPVLRQELLGREFPNPIGLAAGLDKDGEAVDAWGALGFGFAELGTVTPVSQPGNPRPRLFRLPKDRALINRMGFNNAGAAALRQRLARAITRIPIGVNIGKGRQTPLADAPKDYAEAARLVCAEPPSGGGGGPAYLAINVSSPNTPGLRELQDVGALAEIIAAVRDVNPVTPLLVKVAPDMEFTDLDAIVGLAVEKGLAGIIATNTTLRRDGLARDPGEEGGMSGAPLRARSTEFIRRIRERAPDGLVIIGVGGIFTAEDALEKLSAGASLVQVYTSFIYEGPGLPATLARGLARLLRERGCAGPRDAWDCGKRA